MANSSKVVAKLQKQNDDALSIFKNTLKKLADTNKEARFAKAKNIEVIEAKSKENSEIDAIISTNEKISGKIDEFLQV